MATAKKWSLSEWVANFLEEDRQYYESDEKHEGSGVASNGDDLYDDLASLDEGLIEMFLIMAVVASILYLVFLRQQRLLAPGPNNGAGANQAGNLGQAAAPDNGLFPHPGDPAFPEWVAGGIGH